MDRPEYDGEEHNARLINPEEREARFAKLDLFDLIAKGQRIQKQEDARKKLQEQSTAFQAAVQRRANELRARFQWEPDASVVMFEIQTCRHCGSESTSWRGFGIQYHRQADDTIRIAQAECIDRGLPIQYQEIHTTSPVCSDCIPEHTAPMAAPSAEFIPNRKETSE